jgi:hypothetical protein
MRRLRVIVWFVAALALAAFAITRLPVFGQAPSGERLARASRSKHYDGQFKNLEPTHKLQPGALREMLQHQFFGGEQRVPSRPVPIVQRQTADYANRPSSGLRATWIGHASVLIELDGRRVLVDPIFSQRCSPFDFVGPVRFMPPPIALDALPAIDAVVISHDHYDHLDMPTIVQLARRGTRFVVPKSGPAIRPGTRST